MKATGMLRAFCPLFLCPFPAAHMGAERGWHAQTLGGIYRQISVIRCFETVNHFQTTGETMSKETFEYRYEFANGDVMEFSISNDNGLSEEGVRKWVPLLRGMDRSERNNNQKERRRHCSLDAYNLSGDLFRAKQDGFEEYRAYAQWRELSRDLTERERMVGWLYFLVGYSPAEIGEVFDISERYAQYIVRHIKRKILKKYKAVRFWPLP